MKVRNKPRTAILAERCLAVVGVELAIGTLPAEFTRADVLVDVI